MKLATLCYVQRDGHTLMLHRNRKDKDIHLGKWNGLGGKFEPGETPEEAVCREVQEESGLIIEKPCLKGVLTWPMFDGKDDWYAFIFTASNFNGEPHTECKEGTLSWVPDVELRTLPLWEGDYIFIPWLFMDHFFSARFYYKDGNLTDHDVTFYEGNLIPQV